MLLMITNGSTKRRSCASRPGAENTQNSQRMYGITTKVANTIETLTLFEMASAGERNTNGTFCRDVGSHFITSWTVDSHVTNWPSMPLFMMPSRVYFSPDLTYAKALWRWMSSTS